MEKHLNNTKDHGSFSTGFLLGIAVGALLVFLVGTAKGKKLLKALTEEGLEGITEFEELLEDDDYDEILDGEESNHSNGKANGNGMGRLASRTRRFFRGIPRRR